MFEEITVLVPAIFKVSVFVAVALFSENNALWPVLLQKTNEHLSTELKLAQNFQRGFIRNSYNGERVTEAKFICPGHVPTALWSSCYKKMRYVEDEIISTPWSSSDFISCTKKVHFHDEMGYRELSKT